MTTIPNNTNDNLFYDGFTAPFKTNVASPFKDSINTIWYDGDMIPVLQQMSTEPTPEPTPTPTPDPEPVPTPIEPNWPDIPTNEESGYKSYTTPDEKTVIEIKPLLNQTPGEMYTHYDRPNYQYNPVIAPSNYDRFFNTTTTLDPDPYTGLTIALINYFNGICYLVISPGAYTATNASSIIQYRPHFNPQTTSDITFEFDSGETMSYIKVSIDNSIWSQTAYRIKFPDNFFNTHIALTGRYNMGYPGTDPIYTDPTYTFPAPVMVQPYQTLTGWYVVRDLTEEGLLLNGIGLELDPQIGESVKSNYYSLTYNTPLSGGSGTISTIWSN